MGWAIGPKPYYTQSHHSALEHCVRTRQRLTPLGGGAPMGYTTWPRVHSPSVCLDTFAHEQPWSETGITQGAFKTYLIHSSLGHPSIHPSIYPPIHSSIHSCILPSIQPSIHCSTHPSIYPLHKHLLSTYCVPGTFPSARNTSVNRT